MKRIRVIWFLILPAVIGHLFPGGCPAAESRTVDSDEYAVYAAVLFPAPSGMPEGSRPGLPGIGPGPFTLVSDTLTASIRPPAALEGSLVDDFNRKNLSSRRIDPERLRSLLPEAGAGRLRFRCAAEWKDAGGKNAPSGQTLFAPGVIRLSRVGFNHGKTAAAVEIHAIYDPEAGVGYRVLLLRDGPGAPWVIRDAERTRIF